jgi:hypothetical protein
MAYNKPIKKSPSLALESSARAGLPNILPKALRLLRPIPDRTQKSHCASMSMKPGRT